MGLPSDSANGSEQTDVYFSFHLYDDQNIICSLPDKYSKTVAKRQQKVTLKDVYLKVIVKSQQEIILKDICVEIATWEGAPTRIYIQ